MRPGVKLDRPAALRFTRLFCVPRGEKQGQGSALTAAALAKEDRTSSGFSNSRVKSEAGGISEI
jgi:hypothetical protein